MAEANENDERIEHPHELITIYVDGCRAAQARKDICVRLSGWMEAALCCNDKGEQWVQLDGLTKKISDALISYFQKNRKARVSSHRGLQ